MTLSSHSLKQKIVYSVLSLNVIRVSYIEYGICDKRKDEKLSTSYELRFLCTSIDINMELLHYSYIIHTKFNVNDILNTGASMHFVYYAFAKDKRHTGVTNSYIRIYKNKFVALLST